ncbi:MAG: CTP synthetase [Dinoroseobacter sp.]|nr:CTP synthetase [Dinoroseobacter sp.]
MHKLPVVVFSILAPTFMGVGVVVALVAGVAELAGLLAAAGVGAVLSVPVSAGVARALER